MLTAKEAKIKAQVAQKNTKDLSRAYGAKYALRRLSIVEKKIHEEADKGALSALFTLDIPPTLKDDHVARVEGYGNLPTQEEAFFTAFVEVIEDHFSPLGYEVSAQPAYSIRISWSD